MKNGDGSTFRADGEVYRIQTRPHFSCEPCAAGFADSLNPRRLRLDRRQIDGIAAAFSDERRGLPAARRRRSAADSGLAAIVGGLSWPISFALIANAAARSLASRQRGD